MSDESIKLRFVYLTLPERDHPILNINVQKFHHRFEISRDQLYDLNKQIADILSKATSATRTVSTSSWC